MRIIHVSDFHIHPPLSQKGRKLLRQVRSHSYAHLAGASDAIRRELLDDDDTSTVICATGDLSTLASADALRLSRQFLANRRIRCSGSEYDLGIAHEARSLFVLPGNHDRYDGRTQLWKNTRAFEQAYDGIAGKRTRNRDKPFADQPLFSYKFYPQVRVALSHPTSGLACVFYCIDSNELSAAQRINPLTTVAAGRVSSSTIEWLRGLNRSLDTDGRIRDSGGTVYNLRRHHIVRILALHHHPVPPDGQKYRGLTTLANASELTSVIAELEFHAVLFGHEHVAYNVDRRNQDALGPIYFGAPSLSVFDPKIRNGFGVLDVRAEAILWRLLEETDGVFRETRREEFAIHAKRI